MNRTSCFLIVLIFVLTSCSQPAERNATKPIQLVTLDPGHFHAALVQKTMYDNVDSLVNVFAPEGADVKLHLERIAFYNSREKDPTGWKEEVYTGSDFFEKMMAGKKGNVLILSGNNQKKTEYILKSLDAGYNILADKPMAIDRNGFALLKRAFATADAKNLLLYDIMTERLEITTVLQRKFSMIPEVFGTLEKGTPEAPAISKESVHHFYKYVSGTVLTRPAWFLDVSQQGEGIVDVTTHLVDLVQWECFPEQTLDTMDVKVNSARRWTTRMSLKEFKTITKLDTFPPYLKDKVKGDTLQVYSNGQINYQLRGVNAKVSVTWKYKAPEGTGDTHYSIMRGTKANLVIRQGEEEGFKPVLYIEPAKEDIDYEKVLLSQLVTIYNEYPGVELSKMKKGWAVVVPELFREGHEEHFGRVTNKFLEYLQKGNIPSWEVPNMITKYYTTTQALEVAKKPK